MVVVVGLLGLGLCSVGARVAQSINEYKQVVYVK